MKDLEDMILGSLLPSLEFLLLRKFPNGLEITIFFAALYAATKVRSLQQKKKYYWLQSLFLVVCTGFGGGMTAPVLIGRPPIIMTNDFILPCCMLTWYMTHYLGFQSLLMWTPIHLICIFFAMIFKTHAICNTIGLAHKAIPTSAYYPISLTGPIVAGTVNGMMGMFYPLEKGLTPISNGTPWVIQGAVISSVFYHLMINDTTGILGVTLRRFIGEYEEDQVRMMIACLWIICQSTQAVLGPSWNPLDPIYKVLYLILQVDKPEVDTKLSPSAPPSTRVVSTKPLTEAPQEFSVATDEPQRKAKKKATKHQAGGKKVD